MAGNLTPLNSAMSGTIKNCENMERPEHGKRGSYQVGGSLLLRIISMCAYLGIYILHALSHLFDTHLEYQYGV